MSYGNSYKVMTRKCPSCGAPIPESAGTSYTCLYCNTHLALIVPDTNAPTNHAPEVLEEQYPAELMVQDSSDANSERLPAPTGEVVSGWIQSADFNSVDLPEMYEPRQAIGQLNAHNWRKEAANATTLEATGNDWCPAGIGLHTPDNSEILHICPDGAGEFMIFFTHNETHKVFGLFSSQPEQQMYQTEMYSHGDVERLITWFFAREYGAIINAMSK